LKRVLLIRLDKIGDLISTMCVDQSEVLNNCEVHWVIAKGLGFIPNNSEPERKFLELSKEDWKVSLQTLISFIKEFKPEVAVSFQAPWWVNYALWITKVPVRAGVQSQWHSFLFLNKGLRQRRSRATQHEADYNFDLLRFALNQKNDSRPATPILKLKASDNKALLEKYKLTQNNYVTVHPGMAGSALNWPIKNYIELIEKIRTTTTVVITGTAADEPFLKEIKEHFKNDLTIDSNKNLAAYLGENNISADMTNAKLPLINLQGALSATELFTILKNSKAVVVPSTGVAHMAASLGAKTLGLYSPVRVQHPRRWAARGPYVKIFVSGNELPPYDKAMEEITVTDVLAAISDSKQQ
jgi:heptosyltransferase I